MNAHLEAEFVRQYAGGTAVRIAGLRTDGPGSVTVLFGASGAGKTTVLRCLAGLERPDAGSIRFGEEVWFEAARRYSLPARERRLGFVPQDYGLFPHLSVEANVAYGLRDLASAERRRRVGDTLAWLGLSELAHRLPREISGGQQQRVALARAVARRPRLLLLDEPLSALDAPTRTRLRVELRGLLRHLGSPTLLVTHDRQEALTLGDRLVVLHQGEIVQQGSVQEVFSRPISLAVAGILAVETVEPGRVLAVADGLATVQVNESRLIALATDLPANTQEVFVCIRAEEVVLSKDDASQSSARNRLAGRVRRIVPDGPLWRVELDCGFPLLALLTKPGREELDLREGSPVRALLKAPAIHLIPRAD